MITGQARLACYIFLALVQLGRSERGKISVLVKFPFKKIEILFPVAGDVSFRCGPLGWDGSVKLELSSQQVTGSESASNTEPPVPAPVDVSTLEKKTRGGAVLQMLRKLVTRATKQPKENKPVLKEVVERRKKPASFFVKNASVTYIKALPGVMREVNDFYPLPANAKWSIDETETSITLTFNNLQLPTLDRIDIVSHHLKVHGILEFPSRIYIYPRSRVDGLIIEVALFRALDKVLSGDSSLQTDSQLFVTKIENGEDAFYDVKYSSQAFDQDGKMSMVEGVFVVNAKVTRSHYNPRLNYYDVDFSGNKFLGIRNQANTSPFWLNTRLQSEWFQPTETKDMKFYGPNVVQMRGPLKDRWGCQGTWESYNCVTEIIEIDGTQKAYYLRKIVDPKIPISALENAAGATRIPWLPITGVFTPTRYTNYITTGKMGTNDETLTFEPLNNAWIKEDEKLIWLDYTRADEDCDKTDCPIGPSWAIPEILEIEHNATVTVGNKNYKVKGVTRDRKTVEPEHTDKKVNIFSFNDLQEVRDQ